MHNPSKLINLISDHSKGSSLSHSLHPLTHLAEEHHKSNKIDISKIELPNPLNQYCQVVNSQHINHNFEATLISASPYHTPLTKSILTALPPSSKEIANSIIAKFKGTAVRSVVAMRRIEYTAQLNDQKRRHRHIIFIQIFWRHTYPRRLNKRVKCIQKIYRRHYSRMLYLIMLYYNKLFIEFQKKYRKIQLKYLFKIFIQQISLCKNKHRASIGIQAEEEVHKSYMGLLIKDDDKDNNEMKLSRGFCNFPQRKNYLSRTKQKTSLEALNLKMKISSACHFEIKDMIHKQIDCSFLEEYNLNSPIFYKVITPHWIFISKEIYYPSANISFNHIIAIQKKYRQHSLQVKMKKVEQYQSNGIQSFKLSQKTLFNTKLLVLYMTNLLKKKIFKSVFNSLKKCKKSKFALSTQITSYTFAINHSKTDSESLQINDEMNSMDHIRMTQMTENCNGIGLLTMSNGIDDTVDSQDTFSEISFLDEFDEGTCLNKKLPNNSVSIISPQLIGHLK